MIKEIFTKVKENKYVQKFSKASRVLFGKVLKFSVFNRSEFKSATLLSKVFRLTYTFGLLLVTFVFALESNFLWLFGDMPTMKEARNTKLAVPSEIYSSDEKLLGLFYVENRSPIPFEEIDSLTVKALISTEDARFYLHNGLDIVSLSGAVFSTLTGDKRGGSTIHQQLVKNIYNTRHVNSRGLLAYIPGLSTLVAKIKEWDTAIKLDWFFEKNEILALYLNAVDFGDNTFGIKLASEHFFSKKPQDLELHETALLIGILKGTNYYSPKRRPERALARRNVVLEQMLKYNDIDSLAFENAIKKPLGLKITEINKEESSAPYFRTMLRPLLIAWCEENGYSLFSDGLKIYTTIDSRMQTNAEEAVKSHLTEIQRSLDLEQGSYKYWFKKKIAEEKAAFKRENPRVKDIPEMPTEVVLNKLVKQSGSYKNFRSAGLTEEEALEAMNKPHQTVLATHTGEKKMTISALDSIMYMSQFLQAGLLSIDPTNLHVRAYVGGSNYDYFKYDHVVQAGRQPGSAFKPIIYASALENGYPACTTIIDKPFSIETSIGGKQTTWAPKNSNGTYTYAPVNLRRALGTSINSIAIRVLQDVGTDKVIKTAEKLGIQSKLDNNLSLALGTSNVTLLELTRAYLPFANQGMSGDVVLFDKIIDKTGEVVFEHKPDLKQVLAPEKAYEMSYLLRGAVEEGGGTARRLYNYGIPYGNEIGGKTGTTNDYVDAWFMGVMANLVTGVWVGCDDSRIHFTSGNGAGGRAALPIYGKFLQASYADKKIGLEKTTFTKPEDYDSALLNCHFVPVVEDSTATDSLAVNQDSLMIQRRDEFRALDVETIEIKQPTLE
ncbi:penicillin-binding protein 1A [Arcticibacterium luteifluviistationis]|uniref:Transglycosylase n=1 Tax=Arcticibacterium luteifluviistationis TaxID=1784714 RepID=A0A2Z4GBW8_9BACT|nr:transglycosylase domain-containing protein [Arcticibacterium luteifluviistationis]AWV98789.1 transglycosylase [Arcticibacterium luteifluviistationis]